MTPGWAQLTEIARTVGTPFFIADPDRFAANRLRFLDAFRAVYPRAEVAYSCKASYLPAFLREAAVAGGLVEVSSGMEFELALRAGVGGDRLVFNGPGKTGEEIARALAAGSTVNLETPGEVDAAVRLLAAGPAAPGRIGLRCNPGRWTGAESRFGFEPGAELHAAFRRLREARPPGVAGLHAHVCTGEKGTATYRALADGMVEAAAELFRGALPEYLNLGGGFFSPMEPSLREQFPCEVPGFPDYAAALGGPLARAWPGREGPALTVEPGLALAADAMRYYAQVTDVFVRSGRRVALAAGTIYDARPTLSRRNPPMRVVSSPDAPRGDDGPWDIAGRTCMEHDLLHRGYRGPIAPGDWLEFRSVGAYTLVLSPSFMHPRPAVVRRDASGAVDILKRRETEEDALATYCFPAAPGKPIGGAG